MEESAPYKWVAGAQQLRQLNTPEVFSEQQQWPGNSSTRSAVPFRGWSECLAFDVLGSESIDSGALFSPIICRELWVLARAQRSRALTCFLCWSMKLTFSNELSPTMTHIRSRI